MHPQRKEFERISQELSKEVFKLQSQVEIVTLLKEAGHLNFAQQEFEELIVTVEKAKKQLEESGKSFSPPTISFLKGWGHVLSEVPLQWQDLKDRYAKLLQP